MKAKDLAKKKFGYLKVIERIGEKETPNGTRRPLWRCKCSCGNFVIRTSESLQRGPRIGKGIYTSCGCKRFSLSQDNGKKNLGRIKEGTAKRDVLCMYKHAAKKRGLTWELSNEEFFDLVQSPCYYTGWAPDNIHKTKSGNESFTYNGIDRKDNTKGYTKNNCVPCHRTINRMKSNLTYKEFIKAVKAIVNKIDVAIGQIWEKA